LYCVVPALIVGCVFISATAHVPTLALLLACFVLVGVDVGADLTVNHKLFKAHCNLELAFSLACCCA
jgi:hypothetical protein